MMITENVTDTNNDLVSYLERLFQKTPIELISYTVLGYLGIIGINVKIDDEKTVDVGFGKDQ